VGEPLNEQNLFSDAQAIQEMYQKSGYPGTTVQAVTQHRRGERPGHRDFRNQGERQNQESSVSNSAARQAFKERKLRKEIKTRAHWMWSWLTGSGRFKDDQFQEDRERLAEFIARKAILISRSRRSSSRTRRPPR